MYDLVVRGGRVVDPASGTEGQKDIAISGGMIVDVAPGLGEQPAARTIDVAGRIVAPGLIDGHAHVFHGVIANGIDPDVAGVLSGVTTVVDGGSAGAGTFRAFPTHVIPKARTGIIPFIHICSTGLATNPDVVAEESINPEETLRVMQQYPDLIAGIKVRMTSPGINVYGTRMLSIAKELAAQTNTRVMVHIGEVMSVLAPGAVSRAPELTRDILSLLGEGDILTHVFTANPGGVIGVDGKPIPELRDAVERGVILDTALGRGGFAYDVARRCLDEGIMPDIISTDLNALGRTRNMANSLTDAMTRFLALGFSLTDVIAMTTWKPAKAVGVSDQLGTLAPGRVADISILEINEGDWIVRDGTGTGLRTDRALRPFAVVKRGEIIMPEWGPRPSGWNQTPA
jgi:dihydroorotase